MPEARVAGPSDVAALARLREASDAAGDPYPGFEQELADWLRAEGARRTTWLAIVRGEPVGFASMMEYRRMPRPGQLDSRWGYVGNMFVLAAHRGQGLGGFLLDTIITAARDRGYARLVLSPSTRAEPLYRRAGFTTPSGDHDLLVLPL